MKYQPEHDPQVRQGETEISEELADHYRTKEPPLADMYDWIMLTSGSNIVGGMQPQETITGDTIDWFSVFLALATETTDRGMMGKADQDRFDCPLCGFSYYRGEIYQIPQARCCTGCRGDSKYAAIAWDRFWREVRQWPLEKLEGIIVWLPRGYTRLRIRDLIIVLEESARKTEYLGSSIESVIPEVPTEVISASLDLGYSLEDMEMEPEVPDNRSQWERIPVPTEGWNQWRKNRDNANEQLGGTK